MKAVTKVLGVRIVDGGEEQDARSSRRPSSVEGFGRNVRRHRQKLKLTLRDLADRSGVAASTISKVENGLISPTYDKILQLSVGLGIDIDELFYAQSRGMVPGARGVTRAGQGQVLQTRDYRYELLCSEISHKKFVPIVATLARRNGRTRPELIRHQGEEFCYVLSGRAIVYTEFYEPLHLLEGDSCYFDSEMAHALTSGSEKDAVILWVASAKANGLANLHERNAMEGEAPPPSRRQLRRADILAAIGAHPDPDRDD